METDKKKLRKLFRDARKAVSKTERKQAQTVIVRRLKPWIKRGKRIALYWPAGSEADLRALMDTAQQRGAKIYLPFIEKKQRRLWFTPYRRGAAKARGGWAGIPQFAGKRLRAEHLDVMILPLIAADRNGVRLGQGGGFYDASLERAKFRRPCKIGAGFACQLAESALPHEAHDMRLDGFVSERHNLRFRRNGKP
ncbi:MAG: 5-formyltetrahydrofolate cyclo-ligase [Neisseria sp.]|nr:5-formyltetrahydrofolate cyclo-ligase [Neisseria sp.]